MAQHKKFKENTLPLIQSWINEWFTLKGRKAPDLAEGDYLGPWGIHLEGGALNIKREIKYCQSKKKTWQRLHKPFYKELLTNQKELENLIIYLNGEDPSQVRAMKRYKVKNAYLPKALIEKFIQENIENFNNANKKDIKARLEAFRIYGIEWLTKKNPNPLKWKRHEKEWGKCLLNTQDLIKPEDRIFPRNELRSKNTLKRVIWLTNHFLEFLYHENPLKYPLISLDPISKADFSRLERKRKSENLVRERKHIKPEDWKEIKKRIRKDNDLCIIELCYEFGLRRNEALAITDKSLYMDNLYIDKQVDGDSFRDKIKLPKTYEKRRIPYTVSDLWIEHIIKMANRSAQSTASPKIVNQKWRKLMIELGYTYDIHDCRHSFTRRMLIEKNYSIKDVMEFCGHQSISTTNKYLQSKTEYSQKRLLRTSNS